MLGDVDPFSLFRSLFLENPAPFACYLNFDGVSIVSSSPERLLSKTGSLLETRPIKGTIPRGKDQAEDKVNLSRLLHSEKDKAELLMITDLMRNDIGKTSLVGSVRTEELWRVEAYSNVFHLLSVIRSKAKADKHPLDLVRSCFPGGSITGCPKLRAMELILELEKRARKIYTGSLGYFSSEGDFDFNIAIRTLLVDNEGIDLQLGGAIVLDSNARLEYLETLHKGLSIFQVLGVKEKVVKNKVLSLI